MKENRNPNIKKQSLHKKHSITLILQFCVLFFMIGLGVTFLFIEKVKPYLLVSAILFLLLGAYNSYHYLGKKKMPIFYLLASFLLLLYLFGV